LQAYERLILFLERINPENLYLRMNDKNKSAMQLQMEVLKTIRMEYEHNLTQQLYISSKAWEAVKSAKDQIVRMINMAASRVGPNASGVDLAKMTLKILNDSEAKSPTDIAKEYLKQEARKLF
jgi:hypothetical protein